MANSMMFLRKTSLYVLTAAICLAGYFLSQSILSKKLIEKEIIYNSDSASEVEMAWGIIQEKIPPEKFWPSNSYANDKVVYTKLSRLNGKFSTAIKLPVGYDLDYWMVQRKDKTGNKTDIWDSGGKEYYSLHYNDPGIFKPGYFIFLAGFIPLALFYLKNKRRSIYKGPGQKIHIKNYIPQFDSIRAIAVLLVIIHHWFPQNKVLNFLPNGALGVNIFFVLSGFLINGILLKAKKQSESLGLKRSTIFKNFYIRRTLRIFPIYYLLIIVFWYINNPELKQHGIYYFTYTSNILFYTQQYFPARLAHLWSLAVEEQFYILWPWLLILISKKLLPYLITLFLIIGISTNYIFVDKGWWTMIFTPACFDAFAIGGFLSWLTIFRQDIIVAIQPKFKWIFAAVMLFFILDVLDYSFLPRRTTHALLAISIIYYCLFKNNKLVANFVLNNKWLIRIGKISYGVYLYHLFVPELWKNIIDKFASWNIDLLYNKAVPQMIKPLWLFIQEFSFLMIICIVSWEIIEKPINKLKKNFENKPSKKTATEIEKANPNTFSY